MEGKQQPEQFGSVAFSAEDEKNIGSCLAKKLGKENTTSRTGAGNAKYTYIESWRGISLANSIFGFNGWSCSVVDLSPDFIEESNGRFSVGVTAVVRITLRDGTSHEDVGYGNGEHPKRGLAIEKAKKEAVSDARKRALRLFGDALGNCLYDKQHLKRIKSGKGQGEDILDASDFPTTDANFLMRQHPEKQTTQELPRVTNEQPQQTMAPLKTAKTEAKISLQPKTGTQATQFTTVKREPIPLIRKSTEGKLEPSPPSATALPRKAPQVNTETPASRDNGRYQPYPVSAKLAQFSYTKTNGQTQSNPPTNAMQQAKSLPLRKKTLPRTMGPSQTCSGYPTPVTRIADKIKP